MIYKKKPSEILGLWCRSNKTFYFLESGLHSIRNPLDRIRNSLVTRGLVPLEPTGTKLNEEPLVKMSMAEAEERGYDIDCLYLNPHVQKQVEDEREGKTIGSRPNPWKS